LTQLLPHLLSLSRIPLGILFIFAFRASPRLSAFCAPIILVSIGTDYLDGFVARRFAHPTQFGKWLDAFSDFLFFFCVYLSFHLARIMPLCLFLLFALREGLMYTVIRPLSAARRLEVGAKPAGKLKTGLQSVGTLAISVMYILHRYGKMADILWEKIALAILIVLIGASLISLYWYLVPLFRSSSKAREKNGPSEG
jgi:CDP-diacylglycerol--glycerol-3-phosphate 3-phosphatidyltransferase